MTTAIDVTQLRTGDVLLYKGTGLFSRLIGIKTWHFDVTHVEVYIGTRESAASRDGKGAGIYPIRLDGLMYVQRPTVPLQLKAALDWHYREAAGAPYGWGDLLVFAGMNVNAKGMVCSPYATDFLRAGAIPVFNREPSLKVAPFQFRTSELLPDAWSLARGWIAPQEAA